MNTECLLTKSESRTTLKNKVNTLISDGKKLDFDQQISSNLHSLISQIFPNGFDLAGGFVNLKDEPYLTLPKTWKLSLPVIKANHQMDFYLSDNMDLQPNNFGVLEPKPELSEAFQPSEHQFFIVPAVGFSQSGYRLGRGHGYYDRHLSKFKGLKIGVSYSVQMVPDLWSPEEHDIKLDYIVTEKYIVKVS